MDSVRRIKKCMEGMNTKQMINRPNRKDGTENCDKAHRYQIRNVGFGEVYRQSRELKHARF